MSNKSGLRNELAKRFAGYANIWLDEQTYLSTQSDVVIVDAMTRLHALPKPQLNQETESTGAYFVKLFQDHLNMYFALEARPAEVVVWALDNGAHVPITKGVEQRKRVEDHNHDVRNLSSKDPEVREHAKRRIEQQMRIHRGMSAMDCDRAQRLRIKMNLRAITQEAVEKTRQRVTILDLDDMRRTWEGIDGEAQLDMLERASEAGIAVRLRDLTNLNGPLLDIENLDDHDAIMNHAWIDDRDLELVMLSSIRLQALPEPWQKLIKGDSPIPWSRARILRYLVRAIMNGHEDAYTPPPGCRLYIDGHRLASWMVPRENQVVRRDWKTRTLAIETLEITPGATDGEPASVKIVKSTKPMAASTDDPPPLEFRPPRRQGLPEEPRGCRRTGVDLRAIREEAANAPSGAMHQQFDSLQQLKRAKKTASDMGACRPACATAARYANKLGEGDFSLFHWVEQLRDRGDGNGYTTFELVSTDTDILYLALTYIHRLTENHGYLEPLKANADAPLPIPRIVLMMERGWLAHTGYVCHVNNLYHGIVVDLLGGKHKLVPSFLFSNYAACGDYSIGYGYVSPKSFYMSYLEHYDYIGYLVDPQRATPEYPLGIWAINPDAYMRLLTAAYFAQHKQTLSKQLDVCAIHDISDLPSHTDCDKVFRGDGKVVPEVNDYDRLRRALNAHLCAAKYGKLFDQSTAVWRLTSVPSDVEEFKRFRTNITKRMPDRREVLNRLLLLQNVVCMFTQVGTKQLMEYDPCKFGYAPIDPTQPLSRRNIRFAADLHYEIAEYEEAVSAACDSSAPMDIVW